MKVGVKIRTFVKLGAEVLFSGFANFFNLLCDKGVRSIEMAAMLLQE